MQIATCTRLPSSYAFAQLSLQRQTVLGRKYNSLLIREVASVQQETLLNLPHL
jgi:hypothetical protein